MKVEELTKRVAEARQVPSEWKGTSDHRIHYQLVTLITQKKTLNFYLGTFNVLAHKYLKWQNGRWPNNEPPSWFSLDGQEGLESTPLADEANRENRLRATIDIIKAEFRVGHGVPTILCIQECDQDLRREIIQFAEVANLDYFFSPADEKGILWTGCEIDIRQAHPTHDIFVVTLANSYVFFNLVNVHLDFKTDLNRESFKSIASYCDKGFIVGDYNIQTKPICEKTQQEGSYMTLTEFVNDVVRETWPIYELACHNEAWTNFNCKKNCVDPENNIDHMDNILFFSKDKKDQAHFWPQPRGELFGWHEDEVTQQQPATTE